MKPFRKTLIGAVLLASMAHIDVEAQVAQQDRQALVAIYNATDGPNWSRSDRWLDASVADWWGVTVSNDRVTHLDLSSNGLSGELPYLIRLLTDLEELILNDNNLSGRIPSDISLLGNLRVLRLSFNQFSGEIPRALSNLNSLEILALENNQLSGNLPASRFNALVQLTLQNNLLSGTIPFNGWSLQNIRVLNLEKNQLTGKLPLDLGYLSQLTTLIVSDNRGLTGNLPLNLANLKNLDTFWFVGTDLCEPLYDGFQRWINGISDVRRTGCVVDIPIDAVTGSCERSQGEAYLDVNNVRARILNTGGLFWRGGPHVYNVPRFTDSNAIFAGSLWIAGRVGDEIRATATRYGEWEFWAGPIDDNGEPPFDCALYDRVYKISREDIETYETTGETTPDLRDWPTGLGAPTLDANGDPIDLLDLPLDVRRDRTIDLAAGERPNIRGEQTVWWIMNDRGNYHVSTKSFPLGLEVHGMAYASRSSIDAINDATLYNYRIINRSTRAIEDAYVGVYLDVDLGNFADDLVGSDTLRGIGFVYNRDNYDEGGEGYGTPPPALGILVLEGPTADDDGIDNDVDGVIDEAGERNRMSHFLYFFDGGGVTESPRTGLDYYNYLRGRWKDGKPFTYGGFGRSFSEIPANFQYPGDPVTGEFWSQMNIDGAGTKVPPGDGWFYVSSGPFSLEPGEENDFTFSIVWARGDDHLDSVNAMKAAADVVKSVFDAGFTDIPPGLPPQETVTLLSPANGMDHQPVDPILYWSTLEETGAYQIQLISTDGIEYHSSVSSSFQLDSLNINQIYYWRIRGENVSGFGTWSELYHFTTGERSFSGLLGFSDFLVVQNAQGILDPPEGAAADWRGFPGLGRMGLIGNDREALAFQNKQSPSLEREWGGEGGLRSFGVKGCLEAVGMLP
ncbi:MAG: hypothetical protein IIA50_02665 [Bacteroidetes bacterium]|nr:hypothetical protein [Bacteroidota bacterium]